MPLFLKYSKDKRNWDKASNEETALFHSKVPYFD